MASAASRVAFFLAGGAVGAAGSYVAYLQRFAPFVQPDDHERKRCQETESLHKMNGALMKRLEKVERNSIERVTTPKEQANLLGLMPKIWLEALSNPHIYTTVIYAYWQRWEISGECIHFLEWMQRDGALVDLPHMPRRLRAEFQVQYLSQDQLRNYVIRIENGLFVWEVDGTPCNIPARAYPAPANATQREKAVASIVEKHVKLSLHRDECLEAARAAVEAAIGDGREPTVGNLTNILKPCIKQDLLVRLRDPCWQERIEPQTYEDHIAKKDVRRLKYIPQKLMSNLTWTDVLEAIDHDQGVHMKESKGRPLTRMTEELANPKGIFVLDKFGRLLAGSKVRGIFHHSSFCHGHAVSCAGGIVIVDGVLKQLSPHSGHFMPQPEDFDTLMERMAEQGVDFTNVEIKKRIKVK